VRPPTSERRSRGCARGPFSSKAIRLARSARASRWKRCEDTGHGRDPLPLTGSGRGGRRIPSRRTTHPAKPGWRDASPTLVRFGEEGQIEPAFEEGRHIGGERPMPVLDPDASHSNQNGNSSR